MTQPNKKEYDTGAVRSADCEATRYDLISPIGLEALARTYAEGAAKFGAFNWENGMPVGDLLNHAIAHVYKFLSGDRGEDHLAHATWNLLGAIHSLERWPHLNETYLRGPNCECPPMARQPASQPEIGRTPVSAGVFPVGSICGDSAAATTAASNIEESLDRLKRAIFDAGVTKNAENKQN